MKKIILACTAMIGLTCMLGCPQYIPELPETAKESSAPKKLTETKDTSSGVKKEDTAKVESPQKGTSGETLKSDTSNTHTSDISKKDSSTEKTEKPSIPENKINSNILSEGIVISGKKFQKTGEAIIIPKDKSVKIKVTDNSSWSSYIPDEKFDTLNYGVFTKDKEHELTSFAMGQYEVTQELYNAVMGENSGQDKLIPASANFYKSIVFCNELTKKTMSANDVVYYFDKEFKTPYQIGDADAGKIPYRNSNKKGYRLPTEAEWEFAARGGDFESDEWKNAYGKYNTEENRKVIAEHKFYLSDDPNLAKVAWYGGNSDETLREVGTKEKNKLNLFDTLGNAYEWCWEYIFVSEKDEVVSIENDIDKYKDRVVFGILRGGSIYTAACDSTVSKRTLSELNDKYMNDGIRICRSL